MSSSAGVSIRWYPNRRYTATIESSTWSRTETSAGSRSRIPRAGLLSIFMAPSRNKEQRTCKWYGPSLLTLRSLRPFYPNGAWFSPRGKYQRSRLEAQHHDHHRRHQHVPHPGHPARGQAARADPAQDPVQDRAHRGPDDQPGALGDQEDV